VKLYQFYRPGAVLLLATVLIACGESGPVNAESQDATDTAVSAEVTAEVSAEVAASPSAPPAEAEAEAESEESEESNPEELLNRGSLSLIRTWTGDLDAMEEHRVVRILTVYGPGRFYLDEGQGRGLVAEMAKRLEDHINADLERGHVRVLVGVIPVARDQLVPALLAGRGDLINAGMTITEDRKADVDFSIPISKPLNEIIVTGPSAPPLGSLDDLAGKTLYLRETSSYKESAEALSERLVAKGLEPIRIETMPESLEDDDLIEMVNAGLLPWAVVDDYKPLLWKDVFTNLTVRDDLVLREGGRIGWAMRKGSPKLMDSVNRFLKENREGTLFGNILKNRYIRDFDWAANALGDKDYQRFNELKDIFKRYGEAYGIEYLFAAAQAYQESRLDQNVRSAAGAVGVMQLLPSTASDPKVGIPDISDVESNIHAGIKYMDYLRSRYFSDPEITPLNQALLALGAYNAGPARMISLRSKAAEQGYDPNVWFDNVELIAAQDIGRETVQYVANIYRYYLTYRMIVMQTLEREEARKAAGIGAQGAGGS
jgi:membrane-bound lytic murein transglycosylase MltF